MRNRILVTVLITACAAAMLLYAVFGKDMAPRGVSAASGSTGIVINELMASNSSAVPDDTGKFSDYVEIYNTSDVEADISNWGLSDDPSQTKWVFPEGTKLAPKAYLIVYCSGNNSASNALHANFKISASKKDTVVLSAANGVAVDSAVTQSVASGMSLGRDVKDPSSWVEMIPTPGYSNDEKGRAEYEASLDASYLGLLINEFQPSNKTTLPGPNDSYPDWIEIFNPTTEDFDMSGYALSDDPMSPMKWVFPSGVSLKSGEYLLIYADGDDKATTLDALHANFSLASFKESVVLYTPTGQIIDRIDYAEIPIDASYGRNAVTKEWGVTTHPTPGFSNDESGYDQYKKLYSLAASDIYMSEVMMVAAPKLGNVSPELMYDWIELYNASDERIDISGYGLTNNSGNPGKWRFPAGSSIAPKSYLMVMASGTGLSDSKKKSSDGLYYLNYKLSNTNGEVLTLWNAQNVLIDKLSIAPQRAGMTTGRSLPGADQMIYAEATPAKPNAQGFIGRLAPPSISLAAGLYSSAQQAEIFDKQGMTIRYTLDGSEPTAVSPAYSGPIEISKTAVLRARTFDPSGDHLASDVATSSYLIDDAPQKGLSVVCLSTNPENFFDEINGIYSMGPNAEPEYPYANANFWKRDVEKPVHVEVFSPEGELQISQDAGIRIFGAFSRGRAQKGLALIARSEYGPPRFDYPLFESRDFDSYKSFILRASGQESVLTKIRDILATSLVDGTTHLEVQAYRQSVVYLNGQYFGIYNIREKVTKYFIEQHYGIKNPENIDLLVGNGEKPLVGDNKAYNALLKYCKEHDLSEQESYDYVASKIDVENYIDYLVCEMYVANTDTGNIKFFRERSQDPEKSKWRWIYYDFCWTFDPNDPQKDSISALTNPKGHGVGNAFSTQLTRSLMQNKGFRNQFLTRFAELLNTIYTPENVIKRIDKLSSQISQEKARDSTRWTEGASVRRWNELIEDTRDFARKRPGYIITRLKDYFKMSDERTVEIFGTVGKPVPSPTAPPAATPGSAQ